MVYTIDWTELETRSSKSFVEEVRQYVQWAEETENVKLLDTGMTENEHFLSIVVVTSQNIIQLIFNKETKQTTIGTSSRDACIYAVSVWGNQKKHA